MASPNVREQPADYGDPVAEYAALTQGAALTDRSSVGRLRMGGSDALDLLNRLTTNKLEELPHGHGLPTVVTSPKGRVVDLLLVGARSDHLLLLTSPGQAQAIAEWVDFYTFGEDVSMEDAGPETVLYALAGPDAEKVLSEAGAPAQRLPRYGLRDAVMGGAPVVLWHTLSAGAPTFEVVAEQVPLFEGVRALAEQGVMSGGSKRGRQNLEGSVHVADTVSAARSGIFFDAETSGGLLICLPEDRAGALESELRSRELPVVRMGEFVARGTKRIELV